MAPFRVVFMGCPEFAAVSLQALQSDTEFVIPVVFSMPDRPKGRGHKVCFTAVKSAAQAEEIQVRCPPKLRGNPDEVAFLQDLAPDFLVVVAYGLILPREVVAIPRIGAVNLHASLLPAYRGPSPIHHALMNGDDKTGNTVMLMNEKMDEGDILACESLEIQTEETLGSLHDRLAAMGAKLLVNTLKGFAHGKIIPQPQDHSRATYTRKITPELARLNWSQPALVLKRLLQAMTPCPGAWFAMDGERFKVGKAALGPGRKQVPGFVAAASPEEGLQIVCGEGSSLTVETIQRPGKAMVPVAEFLRGVRQPLLGRVLEIPKET